MLVLAHLAIFAQLALTAAPVSPLKIAPTLVFPEAGLDDSAAYRGYQTRFYRDASQNTLQVYLDQREGRVVHVWGNTLDESLAFSARTPDGQPAPLSFIEADATLTKPTGRSRVRTLSYRIEGATPNLLLGWFLMGSMRLERDFQYSGRQREPYAPQTFPIPEVEKLVAALEGLPAPERQRQLALLKAPNMAALRSRLAPTISVATVGRVQRARLLQASLDGLDTLAIDIETDPRSAAIVRTPDGLALTARGGRTLPFTVRISTTAKPLTPLARTEIFTPAFLSFLADASRDTTPPGRLRARRLERQVRGVELLASREKLMAGMPTYATYFGRDMLVSALMMREIWTSAMSEAAIAASLRKLSPLGEVSHEEALGGQAIRETADEYITTIGAYQSAINAGQGLLGTAMLTHARKLLSTLRVTRENYHMIDDELQLPILVARWITDPTISPDEKRAFLRDTTDGNEPRLERLLRAMALVTRMTGAYAATPVAANLIAFAPRDATGARWSSSSWRDSGAGYANGRVAMDVNAIYAPKALEAIADILGQLKWLGLGVQFPGIETMRAMSASPLGRYVLDAGALQQDIATWQGAERHFLVRLAPPDARRMMEARVAAMPADERSVWEAQLQRQPVPADTLEFLALALDAQGTPLRVANTDPATRLFLGDAEPSPALPDSAAIAAARRDVRLFTLPYPSGLLIPGIGPAVANDAFADSTVWRAFMDDPYHGPKVVWGREVNLFLLGAAARVRSIEGSGTTDATLRAYARELRDAMRTVQQAVEASGFHSELWSYGITNGRVTPQRYGTSGDIQLWSTTDLAVAFALSRLGQ